MITRKKNILTPLFLFWALICFAQTDLLLDYNQTRLEKQKTGMLILGGWAVGNIAIGGAMMGNGTGEDRYFHQMNAAWNAVNLGIAALGYLGAAKADPAAFDLYHSMNEQHKLQKILLFNAGLDVGYMLGGVYLIERSKNAENKPERLKGFGRSIILQGGFLFAFDIVNHILHARGNSTIQPLLEGLTLAPGHIGWHWQF